MARRRLNVKMAVVGAVVLAILAAGAAVVLFSGRPDPEQLIAAGDSAMRAQDYESARDNYANAFAATESLDRKVDLLFKLSDAYRATGDWRRAVGCWEQVITSQPKNLSARLGRLKYTYILADGLSEFGHDVDRYWNDITTQATELIGIAEEMDALEKDKAVWEPDFGDDEPSGWDGGIAAMGPYLYFLRGRAAFELARMGAVASPERFLEEAKSDLTRSKELDPRNAGAYRYLAAAFLEMSQIATSRGDLESRQAALEAAEATWAEGVVAAADAPSAHVNALTRRLTQTLGGTIAEARERLRVLEGEYRAMAERFPASAEALGSLAEFYSYYSASVGLEVGREKLDRAIEAAQKAAALDPATVKYTRFAAMLCYRKSSLYADQEALTQAIELLEAALARPQVQDRPGPRHYAILAERLSLCSLLAMSCVERVQALPPSDPQRDELLAKAEKAVHEIEQIQGSSDNPQVVKWQGMLDLARGRKDSAARRLYAAYEQINAASPSGQGDAFLSYTLGKVFEPTSEVGAVVEFLESALRSDIATNKPEALLDYANALLRAGVNGIALSAVNGFEERFGATPRSRQLRVQALIAGGHLGEADEYLTVMDQADPDTLRLRFALLDAEAGQLQEAIQRAEPPGKSDDITQLHLDADDREHNVRSVNAMKAELLGYRKRQVQIAAQLWQHEADAGEQERLSLLCDTLIEHNEIAAAQRIVEAFLDHVPDSEVALFYQGLLSEPVPAACPPARRQEIRRQAIGRMADPVARSMALAAFYQESGRLDDAVTEWQRVMDATKSPATQGASSFMDGKPLSPRQVAAARLFDVASYRENWRLAEEIVAMGRTENLDGCGGRLFAGRLAFARERPREALDELDECLRLRPVFSYVYMLRGNIHAALGNERASIEDTRTAAGLNPVDPVVAKALANALLVRNRRLAGNASEQQRVETRRALEHAIRLNPRDTQVLMAYADLLDDSEPLKALAIRQTIQANAPSLNNAVMLGRLATDVAQRETDEARKAAFFAMAQTAFEQARLKEPRNALLLESYADYYRARGENEKAQQLLVESQDHRLLWRHYYRIGRYEEARGLLERMLAEQATQADALKGLVLIAEATRDREAVKEYAERLLSIEDTLTNRLAQIRTYLDVGLVRDAKYRLQSFKDRYPQEPRIGLMEALLAKRQGQLDRALDLANRNLERNQQDALAWRLRGEICLLSGAVDQAITSFTRSRSLEDNPATTVALAKAYLWAGRDNEAINELKAALDAPGAVPEALMLLERTYRRLGRDSGLRQLYAETLSRWPNSIAWLSRAGSFAIEQQDYGRARDLYGQAYRIRHAQLSSISSTGRDVQYAVALDGYLHASILTATRPDQPRGAPRDQLLDQVVQKGRRYVDTPYAALVLCRMAEAKKAQADLAAAIEYGCRAIDKAWDDETFIAQVLMRVGTLLGPEVVADHCRRRLEVAPQSPAGNLVMAGLARVQGDYDGAVSYIDKCMALIGPQDPQRAKYELSKADVLTAAYRKTSDKRYLRRAIDVYESLARQMPTNNSVLNNLAFMLAQDERDLGRALKYARKALEAEPDNGAYLDTYAYVLHKSGRNAEAAESIVAAIQQYEVEGVPSATVYEHLGMIREALGEKDNALAAYRRASQIAGETAPESRRERLDLAMERLQ